MLRDIDWPDDNTYRTGDQSEPLQFYLDCLSNSTKLDLLLGYFSSAAINVLSPGFAKFLSSGGRVRLIINNILSSEDKDAVRRGLEKKTTNIIYDLSDIVALRRILDEYGKHFFECLAWLIANEKIELKIIKPKGAGISHYKDGIFMDGVDKVAFSASSNFTAFALLENLERVTAFLGWENKSVEGQLKYFEEIFSGRANFVEYLDVDDIQVAIKNEFGNKDINELLIQEHELLEKKRNITRNQKLKIVIEKTEEEIECLLKTPRFPHINGPREYQVEAYDAWIDHGGKGLFAMATGTGKTITSLYCILRQYKVNKFYRFLILVPTVSLATQWYNEVNKKFNFEEVIICSSSFNWEPSIREYGRKIKLGNNPNFCIIITYTSFRGKLFQRLFYELFESELKNITLIADEAHTMGSPGLLKVLPAKIPYRIGLSATPERQFDEKGANSVYEFFDSYPPKFTFQYNMKKAILDHVLCEYRYFPKMIELQPDEIVEYKKITKKLCKFLQPDGKYKDDPLVEKLLIKRKRIVHKAKNKKKCLVNIIEEITPADFKFAFIYVPEGYDPNYDESDVDIVDNDDISIIDEYTTELFNRYKLKLRKFTGETKDRDLIIKQFSDGKLDALLAMKCLDEGIDVPQAKIAIFCSSTGNPRQYIQRRGRVLRVHNQKNHADIYDMIVKPSFDPTETDPQQIKLETNIFIGELRRLINFAVLAKNKDQCLAEIEPLCYDLNIDPYDLANKEETKYEI